jgi:hypothetical protein
MESFMRRFRSKLHSCLLEYGLIILIAIELYKFIVYVAMH